MTAAFPIFVGCGRSGTTLIRTVFDSHPELAVTHEAHFLTAMARRQDQYETERGLKIDMFMRDLHSNSNFRRQGLDEEELLRSLERENPPTTADAVRVVFAEYARMHNKSLYGDKTPGYVNEIEPIARLLPEARFIHVVRDGRAVALSYLERPEWGPDSMGSAAFHWRSRVSRGRQAGQALGPDRYTELRYEDFVREPETHTRRVCDFLGLSYEPAMLTYHERAEGFIAGTNVPDAFKNIAKPVTPAIRDWQDQMKTEDVELFEAIAGKELAEFGYEVENRSLKPGTWLRFAMEGVRWQAKRVRSRAPRITRAFQTGTS